MAKAHPPGQSTSALQQSEWRAALLGCLAALPLGRGSTEGQGFFFPIQKDPGKIWIRTGPLPFPPTEAHRGTASPLPQMAFGRTSNLKPFKTSNLRPLEPPTWNLKSLAFRFGFFSIGQVKEVKTWGTRSLQAGLSSSSARLGSLQT